MPEIVERYSISQNAGLQETITRMRDRKGQLKLQMRRLYTEMKMSDSLNVEKQNLYLTLNEELRRVSIFEAEFTYLKNII